MSEWPVIKLGDLAATDYGFTTKASFEKPGPKFLRITDIQDGSVDWLSVPTCEISTQDFAKHILLQDDIVFARTGATTGKSYLIESPPEAVAASYLIRLRLKSKQAIPSFLYLYFQTSEYWEAVNKGTSGSAQGGFNASKLANLSIPVPPLAEQERIVAILDEAFEGLATATAHTERKLQNALDLFQSTLQSTFQQKGNDWMETTLNSCCEAIFAGGDVPKGRVSKTRKGRFTTPIYSNGVKDDGLYGYTDVEARVTKPSITVSARGTIGYSSIREVPFLPVVRLIVLTPDLSKINIVCLFYAIQQLDFGNTGTSIPQLTVPTLKLLSIPLPPLPEQRAIVEKLDQLSAQTRQLEALYQRQLTAYTELKQSLLHQAFSGKL